MTNLKPYVRKIELLGGTGVGKTETAIVSAESRARKILLKCVGQTNSTIKERLYVYTSNPDNANKIVVCVRLAEEIIKRDIFIDIITNAWTKLIRDSKGAAHNYQFKDNLYDELGKKNNVKAILSLLNEDDKKKFLDDTVDFYNEVNLEENNYIIYNKVKNSLPETEIKPSSKKFFAGIKFETQSQLDNMSNEEKERLGKIFYDTNSNIRKVFYKYFNENDISKDGYYYKELYLDNPDEDFIKAMFTSNNLQGGENLSLEVMCDEINIYVPMDPIIKEELHKLDKEGIFSDNYDNKVFGILDTRGLYHSDNTEEDNIEYCSNLVFNNDMDAIVMVVPLYGDSNEKKISEIYREVIKNFNKKIPVIMLHNKLDMFVDFWNKQKLDYDPLSMDIGNDNKFSVSDNDDIVNAITERERELRGELQDIKNKVCKDFEIKSTSCYLRKDKNMQDDLIKKYNVIHSYQEIFSNISEFIKGENYSRIKLIKQEEGVVVASINEDTFTREIKNHIKNLETYNNVFKPGMDNLEQNIGKIPHGNAYNALCRRLKEGNNYSSNINESYFYICNSFSINFPENIQSFVTQELINRLLNEALDIKGAELLNPGEKGKFIDIIAKNINPKQLVIELLYNRALKEAEKNSFSFGTKFKNFLENSMNYINKESINEQHYIDAIKKIILETTERVLALYTTYM